MEFMRFGLLVGINIAAVRKSDCAETGRFRTFLTEMIGNCHSNM